MPIQPSYPGVYIQEIPSGVRTITGVSTSIAAFFGRTQKGQINKAVRCLSYSDFLREFGGPHQLSDLGSSVNHFFANGGTDCYVVRLAAGATPAELTLKNLAKSKNVLTAVAKAEGSWGQDVKLSVDYNTTNPDDSFNLTVTQETGGMTVKTESYNNLSMNPQSARFAPTFVTQSSKLIELKLHSDMGTMPNPSFLNNKTNTPAGFSQSQRVFTGTGASSAAATSALHANIADALLKMIDINNAAIGGDATKLKSKFVINLDGKTNIEVDLAGVAIPATPLTEAALTGPIKTKIDQAIAPQLPNVKVKVTVETFTPEIAGSNPVAGILRITSDDAAANFADGPNVNIRSAASNDLAAPMLFGIDNGGIEVGRFSNMRPVARGTFFTGGVLNDLTLGAAGLNLFSGQRQDKLVTVKVDSVSIVVDLETKSASSMNCIDAAGGNTGLIEKLRIIRDTVNADVNSPCSAELWGYHLVFFRKSGTINDKAIISMKDGAAANVGLGTGFTENTQRYSLGNITTGDYQLPGADGSDGAAPGQVEYEGDPVKHTGFYALDKIDLFNLMLLPHDYEYDVANVKGSASAYCETRRAFLLLDAPAAWTDVDHPVADATTVNSFRVGVSKQHSAIFYPRVEYSNAGLKKLIGPSGMIAGLMARTDSQRGVWKAPAGTEASLNLVTDVEFNMTDRENGVLNKLGVNCIRKFPNGVVNWGARTLDGSDDFGSEWKYIPIRRLALFLEESLYRGTKWVVFEPNDEPLWAKIRMNINAFMTGLFRQGAFQGSTPDKAFFVKCDGETTTANDRNLGIVNIVVGFAPLKPAEFVIISIQQIPDV